MLGIKKVNRVYTEAVLVVPGLIKNQSKSTTRRQKLCWLEKKVKRLKTIFQAVIACPWIFTKISVVSSKKSNLLQSDSTQLSLNKVDSWVLFEYRCDYLYAYDPFYQFPT